MLGQLICEQCGRGGIVCCSDCIKMRSEVKVSQDVISLA